MRLIVVLVLVVAILLTVALSARLAEGFVAGAPVPDSNYAMDLVQKLLTVSKRMANPSMWQERIALMGKSPVELARAYIKSQGQALLPP